MKTKFTIVLTALFLLVGICANAQVKNQTPKRAESETPIKGDVNGNGVVDVADIAAIIEIMKNNGGTGMEHKNNYYIGRTTKVAFTLDDLDQYVAEKPSEITLPGGDNTAWAVWIYPESWGQPTKAISDASNADEIASFIYGRLTLPEGYTGCYSVPTSDTTYTLEWPE